MILLLPPQFVSVQAEINKALKLNGFASFVEIEPRAGCRRFLLS
jgi:hypothetical protein